MDEQRFDDLARAIAEGRAPRRNTIRLVVGGALGVLGLHGLSEAEAGKKKKKKKKKGDKKDGPNKRKRRRQDEPPAPPPPATTPAPEPCGEATCTGGSFCCDDERAICCAPGSECCNVGPGTGSCCLPPNRCGKPIDNPEAPWECCPPERQWFSTTGLVRCCPPGERSMGTGFTSDDGQCCPEEKYCSQSLTGGTCCGDLAPVCVNPATGQCCTSEATCGTTCCPPEYTCCNGECRPIENGPWTPCGTFCCGFGLECCGDAACCTPGYNCFTPCGELDAACCHPDAGNCCNTDCGDNCAD